MTPGATSEQDQFRVAARIKPWAPLVAYASPEDTGYAQRASLPRRAVIGRLQGALGSGFAGRIDRATTIEVGLLDGELASVSELQMLNGANAAAIVAADGAWEILQFQTAEEVSADVWRLSTLLRGQCGTEQAMQAGAEEGAWFVLLDGAVVPAGLLTAEDGLTLNWRVGPAGEQFSDTSFSTQPQEGGLRGRTPLSPAHLGAAAAGGDIAVSWIRRGRVDADSWSGSDIPLGEETEAYLVEVAPDGGGAVRSVNVDSPAWLYEAADIAADFSALPAEIVITVRQLSASAGPGDPASCSITAG